MGAFTASWRWTPAIALEPVNPKNLGPFQWPPVIARRKAPRPWALSALPPTSLPPSSDKLRRLLFNRRKNPKR